MNLILIFSNDYRDNKVIRQERTHIKYNRKSRKIFPTSVTYENETETQNTVFRYCRSIIPVLSRVKYIFPALI